ncbi:MAG: signal peptidase I [Candidatus Cryptobacteroides sp.]|nr:signal peptidase I [Candidatus Cryptobacteroides sp.]
MNLRDLYHSKWVRMGFWSLLYLLWVIWLGNFWWLFGLVVIFDHHITKKVKWLFWKKYYKEGEKRNTLLDWLDAVIFAVVFVTFINIFFFQAFKIPSSSMESSLLTGDHLFVSKLAFGPRIPQTPLTVPFTHNVIFGKESYSTLIQNDYRRLKGFRNVRRGDYVVFGFPDGDTVLVKAPAEDYYTVCRLYGKDYAVRSYGPVVVRPSDKKDHYVKRCVAVAGDTLSIVNGQVYVNSEAQAVWPGVQTTYSVVTNGTRINLKTLEKLGLNLSELYFDESMPGYPQMPLTAEMLDQVRSCPNVVSIEEQIDVYPPDYPDSYLMLFPFTENFRWTRDNYGPLWIPKAGETVKLDASVLPLYERIIRVYEGNDLDIDAEGRIYVNGTETDEYTFKQDYYFMMGDNRHNSLDSRYWGFVPEDHIVGRPAMIWLSTDRNRQFPHNVRWRRFFKFV